MKKLTIALFSTTAILIASGAANAADFRRPAPAPVYVPPPAPIGGNYVSVFGGYGWSAFGSTKGDAYDHDEFTTATNSFAITEQWATRGKVGNGWLLGAAIGTHLNNNVRGEFEVSFARINTKTSSQFSCADAPSAATGGCTTATFGFSPSDFLGRTANSHLDAVWLLANMWYDFAPGSAWDPYIGAGVGAVHVKGSFNSNFTTFDATNAADFLNHNVDAWGLGMQAGVGIKYNIAPNMTIDLGYRFKTALNLDTSVSTNFETENFVGDASGWTASDKLNFGIHTVQLGLTVGF